MSESSYRRYVLGQLRMARVRAKMLINEIDTIGKMMRGGWVAPDDALRWMTQEALALVQCEPFETIRHEAEPSNERANDGATHRSSAGETGIAGNDHGHRALKVG